MVEFVNCNEHGKNEGCMICQHLVAQKDLCYAKLLVDPHDDDFETAMCEACETLLLDEQEWSDKLNDFAEWKLFCRKCYERILQYHKLVAEGGM